MCNISIPKPVSRHLLLAEQLLADQFSGYRDSHARFSCESSLRSAQSRVRGAYRASRDKHLAVALQHYKGGVLIGEPAKGREGNETVGADHDQTAKAMPNSGKPASMLIGADAVFD
jgi:hypothetical protein